MPNIRPLSDLRSYTSVLEEVAQGAPVFLTRNGRGSYVILDIRDYERYEAERILLSELEYGKRSLAEQGGLTTNEVEELLRARKSGIK